jgi:lysozyme
MGMIDSVHKEKLRNLLIRHEGKRSMPYRCTMGRLTIGVGHNLEARPLSDLVQMMILDEDIDWTLKACVDAFAWFNSVDMVRQDVVVDMAFQIGIEGLKEFKNFCAAMSAQNYEKAAEEMMSSRWAKQTPNRALELQTMMRSGKYPT